MKLIDLTGRRFGRLIVLERDTSNHKRPYWICKCDCRSVVSVSGSNLSGGITRSCGCLKHTIKHGDSVSHKRTRLFSIYHNMITRCTNESSPSYKYYGGQGIYVCDEWLNDYQSFRSWATENGYSDNLSLDRINNDFGYYPNNCRWADVATQNNNKTNHILITYNGETFNAKQWSKITGLKYPTIVSRYNKGLPVEKILSTVSLKGGGANE